MQQNESILIFGVGELQKSIIYRAKAMGLYVVGIDPCADAMCRDDVDAFEVVGGQDYEGTLAVARKYNISAVVTAATDKPLVMMARVAKELGLPFFSEETALWSTDKYQMKQRFLEGGVPCARGRLVSKAEEAGDLYLPLIVKPRDNSGSRGVIFCRTKEELQTAIDEALGYSRLDTVLVEEFIEGQEYSIESLHYDGKSEVIQFTEKKTTEFPYNVELGHKQPALLTSEQQNEIRDIIAKIAFTLRFENCPSHTELKINERGVFVIETSPRLGGDYITSHLVPLSTGINMENQLLRIALGEQPDLVTGRVKKAAGVCFFNFSKGVIKSINLSLKEVSHWENIDFFEFKLSEGDKVPDIINSLNRYGEFIVRGDDRKEIEILMSKYEEDIMNKVVVYSKLIAIVGAGEAAMPIIRKAKEMGVKTLAFGRLDSAAKNEVDYFIEENSFDIDFMAEMCRKYQVDGVIASSEITTEPTAILANRLGLPGNSVINGFAGKNKYEMRCRVSTLNSIKQPNYELYIPEKKYEYPVVVKSVDACGKRGISLATNDDELAIAVKLAQDNSSDGSALIEEYLSGGQEYSIECISSLNEHMIVQYTEKESSGPPHFVEIAHHQPALFSGDLKKRINIAVSDVLDVLGLNCGMAHLELKIVEDEIYFIEVGARHGGDHIGDTLTVNSTDCDYFKAAIECCLGTYKPQEIHNIAHTGIYFHCLQNQKLSKLFEKANNADWCIANTVNSSQFGKADSNVESSQSGYFIYKSDHKISLEDVGLKVIDLSNSSPMWAKRLIYNHLLDIKTNVAGEMIDKWLRVGNYVAMIYEDRIISRLILYCTHEDKIDAKIVNVYTVLSHRRQGLAKKVMKEAISIARGKGFQSISLDVEESNVGAIKCYKNLGFEFTGNSDGTFLEMRFFN